VKFLAIYGAFPEHTIYYIVEAETLEAVDTFLYPGFKRCTSKITPVAQVPIEKYVRHPVFSRPGCFQQWQLNAPHPAAKLPRNQ
jgi:hypothetical protein